MSDLICKNSGYRCQTPGMCAPHGGCRETEPVSSVWLAQLRSEFVASVRECERLQSNWDEMKKLREAHGFDSWVAALVEIDRLRKDAEWIKCSDRLPEIRADVIAVDKHGDIAIGYFYYGYKEKLCFADPGDNVPMPTHWKPLPAMPAKDVEQ